LKVEVEVGLRVESDRAEGKESLGALCDLRACSLSFLCFLSCLVALGGGKAATTSALAAPQWIMVKE
jgi:hypothetical protein